MEGGRGRMKSCERGNMVPKERRKHHQKWNFGAIATTTGTERARARESVATHTPSRKKPSIFPPRTAPGCTRARRGPSAYAPKLAKVGCGALLRTLIVIAPAQPPHQHTQSQPRRSMVGSVRSSAVSAAGSALPVTVAAVEAL